MYLFEQIGSVLENMMKNKLRFFLTMIGIVVGVCSVVIIISVGLMTTDVLDLYFSGSLGDNTIISYIYPVAESKNFDISYRELKEFEQAKSDLFEEVLYETEDGFSGNITIDDTHYAPVTIKGVSDGYAKAHQTVMLKGRFLTDQDREYKSSAVVVSDIMAECCFDSIDNAVNKSISVIGEDGTTVDLVIVGVYRTIDNTGKLTRAKDRHSWVSNIYCTYEYFNKFNNVDTDNLKFSKFSVLMKDFSDSEYVISQIKSYMEPRFDDEDYIFASYLSFNSSESTNSLVYVLMLAFIAAAVLSLVVGGISLMNTMLVNVKERTKEIGTKKAIGASNGNIVFQFVLESVVICICSCLLGIIISCIFVFVVDNNLPLIYNYISDESLKYFLQTSDIHIHINLLSIVVSVLFSIAVGITFGVYPALKAAKMPVTEALRYE